MARKKIYDYLMMRDGRNPYGSRGGYVVPSRSRMRDRDMGEDYARGGQGRDMGGQDYARSYDYASNQQRNSQQDNRDYADYNRTRNSREYEQNMQYYRDYAPYGVGQTYYPIEAMGVFNGYYGMPEQQDYMQDGHTKLSTKDIKKWEKDLENADGTKGKKYDMEQIKQIASQMHIKFEEYSPELFTAIVNMLYSDYCKVIGGDLTVYVKMAKAFLEDDDFEGTPEEKAFLYYKCIVSKEDD